MDNDCLLFDYMNAKDVGREGREGMHSVLTSWDQERDAFGNFLLHLTTRNLTTKESHTHVFTRNMLLADLSQLQTNWHAANVQANPMYSDDTPPPVGFYGDQLWMALNHDLFLYPERRPEKDIVLTVMEQEDWEDQRSNFESDGYTINKLDGAHHHTVYIKIERGGAVSHFSTTRVAGALEFDCYYWTVDHEDQAGNDVVQLLPLFLTDTTLMDSHICFVYLHLVPRAKYVPIADVRVSMMNASHALTTRPLVLRDFRENPGDEGRSRLTRRDFAPGWDWEIYTALLVTTFSKAAALEKVEHLLGYIRTLTKAQRREQREKVEAIVHFISSEAGRDQLQDALQYGILGHPAYIEAGDMQQFAENGKCRLATSNPAGVYDKGVWEFMWILTQLLHHDNDTKAREYAHQRADEERRRRQQMHDAMQEAEQAEERARALRRRLQAIEARRARAVQGEAAAFTPRREPPRSGKSAKKADRQQRRQAQLEHEVHVLPEQREYREDAFNVRQMLISVEATARKARSRAADMKQLLANMSAAKEAATHVAPPPPSIFDAMGRPGANLGAAA
jgi:hypothetical protein